MPDLKYLRPQIRADLSRTPALVNDKPVHIQGLDQAIHDLESVMMHTMTKDIDTLRDTRAASVLTFREQIDYDARVATSPGIRTICEIGFYCGQSATIFLEVNPKVKVISFDDFVYPAGEACYNHLQQRYPGRIHVERGLSQNTIPAFIAQHTGADGQYNGPTCDLIRTDARAEYELRRADMTLLQKISSCSTLILFNDICDVQNCHLYQVKNCYWHYGTCEAQNPLFFEGAAMVYQEMLRRNIVESLDEFFLGVNEPNFYKSFGLGRMVCGADLKPKPLPAAPLFKDPVRFQQAMQACFKKGGCSEKIPS